MRHFMFSALLVLFGLVVSAPAFGAFISFGLGSSTATSSYQGPADVVASPILFYGVRPVSQAYAIASGKLANIVRGSDSHACDVLAAASGTLGITANCGTGGDNGQTAAAFCNLTTCKIATLYDQSGANACAGPCDLTQATAANQPALAFTGCISTLPCMSFGANANVVLARASSPSRAQPFTFAAVWNQNGTCGAGASLNLCVIFSSDSAGSYVASSMNSSNLSMRIASGGGGSTPNNAYTQNTWNNTQAVFSGANSKLFFDGTGPALVASPGTASMANSLKLGNDLNNGNGAFAGSITEVGVWGSGFTSVQQLALCTNQTAYYGLPGSCTSSPTVAISPASVNYTGGGAAAVLNSGLAASSLQLNLTSATAQITANLDTTNDSLALPTTTGISSAYTASTGTLLMTGPVTVAAFQAALRTVTYQSAILDPTGGGTTPTRTITWQINE